MQRTLRRTVTFIVSASALALIAVWVLPALIPVDAVRSTLEERLTAAIGQPVKLEQVSFRLLPRPQLAVETVQVGSDSERPLARLTGAYANAALGEILSGQLRLRVLGADRAVIRSEAFAALQTTSGGEEKETGGPLPLERIRVRRLTVITVAEESAGPYTLDGRFDDSGRFADLTLRRLDGSLSLNLQPKKKALVFSARAKGWMPSLDYDGPRVDSLVAKGTWASGVMQVDEFSLSADGRVLEGTSRVTLKPGPRVSANAVYFTAAPGMRLGPFAINGRWTADGSLENLSLKQADDSLSAEIRPADDSYALTLTANKWRSPLAAWPTIDELHANAQFNADILTLLEIRARIGERELAGKGRLAWKDGIDVSLDSLTVRLSPELQLGPYRLEATGPTEDTPSSVQLTRLDDSLHVALEGHGTTARVRVQAKNWIPPGTTITVDSVTGAGEVNAGRLRFDTLRATLAGNELAGDLEIGWVDGVRLTSNEAQLTPANQAPIGPFNFEASLKGGALTQATFNHTDETLTVRVEQHQAKQVVSVRGRSFAIPMNPAVILDSIEADGEWSDTGVRFPDIRMQTLGGTAQGDVTFQWNIPARLESSFKFQGVDATKASKLFGEGNITGTASGTGHLVLHAEELSRLAQAPAFDGEVTITDGVILKTDLEKAASLLRKVPVVGGQTPFDTAHARFEMREGRLVVPQMDIASARLEASGKMTIEKGRQIAGDLEVGLKSFASIAGIPLVISGTLDEPRLRPSTESVAGAAVGTAILGPGVGTAVGVKAGQAVRKLRQLFAGEDKSEEPAPAPHAEAAAPEVR